MIFVAMMESSNRSGTLGLSIHGSTDILANVVRHHFGGFRSTGLRYFSAFAFCERECSGDSSSSGNDRRLHWQVLPGLSQR